MKISVDIEATPQEVREFLGLPDLRELQQELLQQIQTGMDEGAAGFDPISLMRPLFPAQMQSLEGMQKSFWDAFGKAAQEDAGAPAAPKKKKTGAR